MKKSFKFFLTKAVSWYPRFRQLSKTIIIQANDSAEARRIIFNTYAGWEVSMFWEVWP
jgi:hypothetical protein